jgi:hypothetical protein
LDDIVRITSQKFTDIKCQVLNKRFEVCVKYKIWIKSICAEFCAHMLYVCGDTIQVEVVVLCVLISLYSGHLYALATSLLGKSSWYSTNRVATGVGQQKYHLSLPGVKPQLLGYLAFSLVTVKITNICKRT